MMFELLLSACLQDWWEAKGSLDRCDYIWHLCDPAKRDQKYLREVRRLLDGLRAVNALEPHAMEDPGASRKGSGDEDDDVGRIEECEGDEEGEEVGDEGGDKDKDKDEEPEDATTQTGETTEVDSSVKPGVERMPSETVGVEEVKSLVEPSPKASDETAIVEDISVKPGMGLLSELSQQLREKDTGNRTNADTRTTAIENTAPVLPELEFLRDRRVVSQNLQALLEKDADSMTSASESKLATDGKITVNNETTDSKR
jgi:hypothetical protein